MRIKNPPPFGSCPIERGIQGTDRIGAAASGPKPVGTGLEPGLPLRLQRVTDPRLMAPVHDRGDTERPLLAVGLRNVHTSDGHRFPRRTCTMLTNRHAR